MNQLGDLCLQINRINRKAEYWTNRRRIGERTVPVNTARSQPRADDITFFLASRLASLFSDFQPNDNRGKRTSSGRHGVRFDELLPRRVCSLNDARAQRNSAENRATVRANPHFLPQRPKERGRERGR